MISVQISGTMPTMPSNPIPDAMQSVAEVMEESILANLAAGGRPDQWLPRKKDGGVALRGFMRDVSSRYDGSSAEAGIFNAEVKHYANQFGAEIPPVEGKLMVFEIDGVTVFTRRRRGFTLPARPYVMFQQQDVEDILRLVTNAVLRGVRNEPITAV